MPTPSVKSNLSRELSSTEHLQGWLMKQTHGRRKIFKKRYFILFNEELRYYKNKDDTSASAIIALEHYTLVPIVEPEIVKDNDRTFCLISDDESKFDWPDYLLQAESETEKQIWIDRLQTISRYSVSVLDKWLKRMEIIESEDPKKPRKYSRIHPQIEHHIIHPSQYNHEV